MDSSSENMDSSGEGYGTLLFFRKDGAHSLPYPLTEGPNTVGSCSDADVRLKINDDCLEKIHCVVDVNENGIATIINKSAKAPIKVNGILIRKYKVLNDKDTIDIVGKKCQYFNENISNEEVKKNEEALAKKALTPSSNRRRTIAPQVQGRSASKNSPNLRTKTPVQVQKMSLKRKSEGSGVQHISSVTPEKRLDQRSLSEKSKTTSKLVVSKALGALKANSTKRRLSLGSGPRKPNNNVNARVSARNIQFNKNAVTSMITEDEQRPSLSMKQISTPVNKKLEFVKSSSRRSMKKSLPSGYDLITLDSPRKSILKNTPKKSVPSVDDNINDLLTKTVSFSNVKIHDNDKDDDKYLSKRNTGNSSGILYSDETEHLRLSSLSSLSPLGSYPSQDSLFSSSDTESPKKSVSRLSLRKSMENQIDMPLSRKSRLSLAKKSFSVENSRNSLNASKTRISSRNSINIPKETTGDLISEDKSTSDEINKTDSSDESINLQLSASPSSSDALSTKDIKDVSVTSLNIPTLKQRDSMLGRVSTDELSRVSSRGIESQDSEVSSSNSSPERDIATQSCDDAEKDESVSDKVNEKYEISTRKSSLRRNHTMNDSLEEDMSLAEELPLSPIHPLPRRSSTRKSSNFKMTSETPEYNLQASLRKNSKSFEQDEENDSLNISEDHQHSKSIEDSRQAEISLTAEELPSLSSRRSSVRKSHKDEKLVSSRRSSLKIPDDFVPDVFSSQGNRVSETTRISLRKSNNSLVEHVDEPAAKGKKSLVSGSPLRGETSQIDVDTPSYSDNNKSVSSSYKNRSLRNSRNSSTSRIQNASSLSLNDETPETNRRPSLRNSSRRSLVENLGNESQTSFVTNRKSSFDNSQENLTPELEITSSVKTPQSKRTSSIKHRESSYSDIQENLTLSLKNTSELENRSIKNRKSSLGRQQDLTLAGTTPVPRSRSSVRGRNSLVDDIQGDLTLPVDHEMQEPENSSTRKIRKSSIGILGQEKTLPLEENTPVPRNRSSVKSRKSRVDDLQEDLTEPMEYDTRHDESSIYDLHENSTLPTEDETPSSKTESFRRSRKSSHGDLQEDPIILLEGQSPVRRNRSSVKSRKSSVKDLHEDLTLPMEDDTPNSKMGSSRRSRKSSLAYLQQGSVLLMDGQSPVPRSRSSVKSRKSSVTDLHEDSSLLMEEDTPNSKMESSRRSRKSSLGDLQQGSVVLLDRQSPLSGNRSSVNDLHEDSTLLMEDDASNSKIESSRRSRKSSLANLQQGSVVLSDGQSPPVRNRSSVKSRQSSVKSRQSSVTHLHEDSSLLMEEGTPNSKMESSRRSRKPSLGDLQQGSVVLLDGQSPLSGNRSSVNDLHEDSTLLMEDDTSNSKIESSRRSRKSSLANLQQGSVVLSDGQSPPPPRNRSSVKSRQSSVKSRQSSVKDLREDLNLSVEYEISDSENESFKNSSKSTLGSLHHNSTLLLERQTPVPRNRSSVKSRKSLGDDLLEDTSLPLEGQTPIPRNRSSVKHRKSSVNGLHENSTLPLEFQQDLVVTLDNKTPELSRSSIKIKNSSIHFSEGTLQPLESGTPQPSRRSSRTPKPSQRYSERHTNQSLANQSEASVVCLETSISSVKSKPFSVSDNEESVVQTPETAEKFQKSSVGRLSSFGRPPQNSGSDFIRSSVNSKTPAPYRRSVRRSSKLEESYTISLAHSTLNECNSSLYKEFSIEDSRSETPELSRRSSTRTSKYKNSIDSDTPDVAQEPSGSRTPGTGVRSSRRNQSTEDLYGDESHLSMRSETPEANQVYTARCSTLKKDISVADTLDSTPENNTSIVFIDSPLDESRKPGHSRLSKTLYSKIEEVDLTTPKSAIKSRRRKSQPYQPETEDITPVSPLDQNKSETGFKTPLTTPGVFEDIRKSVLKSRSRLQKSSSSFMEELNKAKSGKKASKRPRESNGDSVRQHKRRKLVINEDDTFESYDDSFESFQSEEALTDISTTNLSQDAPSHFSDLTDKPVITHPHTRFSTGDTLKKRQSTRRSLPASTMMVLTSGSNSLNETSEEDLNELSEEVKWVKKSPEKDQTNVAGVKKLMKTPRVQNSPKNDLSDVRGIKKLLATPRDVKSPKNDLTNIVGVKKLLATPKEMKSPKNDLTNIPNLRRIMSPKYQNSPVNDLSDLRGLKKLLSTPKESKDPLNELSDLEGVAEMFNISGVHRLSNSSDIENNEDMFGQLIVRRPLKTYRGKSLSPNKAIDSYGAKRKTMGDKTITSPRVEDWVKEQAVIKIKRLVDLGAGDGTNESDLEKDVEEQSTRSKKKTRVQEIKEEIGMASPPRRGGRRKAAAEEESESSKATSSTQNKVGASTPTESPVRKTTRGKSKKVIEDIAVPNESKENEFTKEVESLAASESREENSVESPRATRGRKKAVVLEEKPTRGRRKVANQIEIPKETEEVEKPIVAKTARGKKKNIVEEKSEDLVVAAVESPKPTRGRKKVKESPIVERTRGTRKLVEEKSEESESDKNVSEQIPKAVRGKRKVIIDEEQSNDVIVASVESPVAKSRGRRKITVEVPVEEKVTRGRKKAVQEPEEAQEKPKENDVVFVDSPKIPTTGRRIAKVIEEVIVEKPTRGRRKAGVKGKAVEESSDDALCESSEVIEFKKPASRKNTKDTDISEESEFTVVKEADTNEVSKKITRGTKKVQKVQDVFVESPKKTRGRRKVMEVVESTDSEETIKGSRKGRNVKAVQVEDSKELLVSSTDINKPTAKSSKVTKIEDEISSTQVDSTTGDFPIQSEDSKEENVSKPIRGRKTRKNVEIEADMKLGEKPEVKRTKRGRKVSSDEALNSMEAQTETEEVEDNKITKPKSKKVATKKDSVEDSENSRPTRGGRNKGNEDVSSATAKKQTRGKKVAEEEDNEVVKVTRSRRRKESEDTEEPPKKISRKNENTKEKEDEASTGNTRKAGRLAKNKAVAKIMEEEVSSPKTRSVKGNFNKYGSSFETESPGKAVGRRKRVHFD